MAKYPKFSAGDRVAYSAAFLRNTGQHTTGAANRRGTYAGDYPGLPSHGYMHWDDEPALIAAKHGQFIDDDYCDSVLKNGELICLANIAKLGSVRFSDPSAS